MAMSARHEDHGRSAGRRRSSRVHRLRRQRQRLPQAGRQIITRIETVLGSFRNGDNQLFGAGRRPVTGDPDIGRAVILIIGGCDVEIDGLAAQPRRLRIAENAILLASEGNAANARNAMIQMRNAVIHRLPGARDSGKDSGKLAVKSGGMVSGLFHGAM